MLKKIFVKAKILKERLKIYTISKMCLSKKDFDVLKEKLDRDNISYNKKDFSKMVSFFTTNMLYLKKIEKPIEFVHNHLNKEASLVIFLLFNLSYFKKVIHPEYRGLVLSFIKDNLGDTSNVQDYMAALHFLGEVRKGNFEGTKEEQENYFG